MGEFFQVAAQRLAGITDEEWSAGHRLAAEQGLPPVAASTEQGGAESLDATRQKRIQQAHDAGDVAKLREQLRAADEDRVRMHGELCNLRREREAERATSEVQARVMRLEGEHLKDLRILIRVLERLSDD